MVVPLCDHPLPVLSFSYIYTRPSVVPGAPIATIEASSVPAKENPNFNMDESGELMVYSLYQNLVIILYLYTTT